MKWRAMPILEVKSLDKINLEKPSQDNVVHS